MEPRLIVSQLLGAILKETRQNLAWKSIKNLLCSELLGDINAWMPHGCRQLLPPHGAPWLLATLLRAPTSVLHIHARAPTSGFAAPHSLTRCHDHACSRIHLRVHVSTPPYLCRVLKSHAMHVTIGQCWCWARDALTRPHAHLPSPYGVAY